MPDKEADPKKVANSEDDLYAGLTKPTEYNSASGNATKTVSGGAFWVRGQLVDANGEILNKEKVAAYKKHLENFPVA